MTDRSFFKQPLNQSPNAEEEMKQPRGKAEAQQELYEKFQLRDTSDFQLALIQGKFELAQQWLDYIVENKENFSQYLVSWDRWLSDRQKEIEIYRGFKLDGTLEEMVKRSKQEAQAELKTLFGFFDSKGFQAALTRGEISQAEKWLTYIEASPNKFPQYLPNWENWLSDRKRELEKAKQEG